MKISRWITLSGLVFALSVTASGTRSHAQDRDHYDDHDRGRHDHDRFDDHDRDAMRDWYHAHHDHPPVGFRDRDRLPPEYEGQLREGFVLTPRFLGWIHPVPVDLYRRFPPPAPGYRYVVIGDHVCLIDRGYRVHDVVHFELNF